MIRYLILPSILCLGLCGCSMLPTAGTDMKEGPVIACVERPSGYVDLCHTTPAPEDADAWKSLCLEGAVQCPSS